MKVFANVMKVLTALAAVAGAVYVVATYGDQIVAWAKKLLASAPKCPTCEEEDVAVEAEVAPAEEAPAEEPAAEEAAAEEVAPVEEAPVEEAAAEEPAAEEIAVEEGEPVAEETDFEA